MVEHLEVLLGDLGVHVQALGKGGCFDHPVRRWRLWPGNLVAALNWLEEVPSLPHRGRIGRIAQILLLCLGLRLGGVVVPVGPAWAMGGYLKAFLDAQGRATVVVCSLAGVRSAVEVGILLHELCAALLDAVLGHSVAPQVLVHVGPEVDLLEGGALIVLLVEVAALVVGAIVRVVLHVDRVVVRQ